MGPSATPHARVDWGHAVRSGVDRLSGAVRLSVNGLAVAGLLFALSLFPSLLPRGSLAQGIGSGVMAAVGYGLGSCGGWAWRRLGLAQLRGRARRVVTSSLAASLGLLIAASVWQHVGWQNEVRALMGVSPTTPATWPVIAVVTLAVSLALVATGRGVGRAVSTVVTMLGRRLPVRLARGLAVVVAVVVVWGLWSGVVETGFFAVANWVSAPRDAGTDPGVVQPTSPTRSGSPESLVAWDSLGRKGRAFVASGPTVADLDRFGPRGATAPIRVYAGLQSADTPQARADLVLAELLRTGAFERGVLVVATTTGTGFLDPKGVDAIEYVHHGDTAIVASQYSYLPSWISVLADREAVRAESLAVFQAVHAHWSTLPDDDRPRLYLYGMSLGAVGSEAIMTSVDILNEPIDGALLVGPPFLASHHGRLVAGRDPTTPPWLPLHDTGRTVRFMAHDTEPRGPDGLAPWGPTRVLYLQNSSDPVVSFSPNMAVRQPAWLAEGQRGPDVSDDLFWAPIVTMWQVLLDLPVAGSVPDGFGHNYRLADYARGWAAVTQAGDWTESDTSTLTTFLEVDVGARPDDHAPSDGPS